MGWLFVGLVLSFVPALGTALRPLARILIPLGIDLIALILAIAVAVKMQQKTKATDEAIQADRAQSTISKSERSRHSSGKTDAGFGSIAVSI